MEEKPCKSLHKCDSCGKSFASAQNLKYHIKAIHDKDAMKHEKCDYCGKLFANKPSLKKHIKIIHEGQNGYKCFQCDKVFRYPETLQKHNKQPCTTNGGQETEQR